MGTSAQGGLALTAALASKLRYFSTETTHSSPPAGLTKYVFHGQHMPTAMSRPAPKLGIPLNDRLSRPICLADPRFH